MEWEHGGFVVEEGKRPGSPVNNRDEYFFLVLKDDAKVFKYCVWLDKKTKISERFDSEQKVLEYLRAKGIDRVREKIETRDFKNMCLLIDEEGEREILLDELDEKLE